MKAKNDNTSDKSKPAYWKAEGRLFCRTWERKRGGRTVRVEGSEWCFTLAHQGVRKLINTHLRDRNLAAQRACAIYKKVAAGGWEAAFSDLALGLRDPSKRLIGALTVGGYIEAAGRFAQNPVTHAGNARSFRQIVGEIFGIKGNFDEARIEKTARRLALEDLRQLQAAGSTKAPGHGGKHHSRAEKAWIASHASKHREEAIRRLRFDYRTGGRQQWLAAVDAVHLDDVTPAKVEAWRISRIREAAREDVLAEDHAKNTAGSLMRQAAALFKKQTVKLLRGEMKLPETLPFEGVTFGVQRTEPFKVQVPWDKLMRAAFVQLAAEPEMMKAFLLAASCGLRVMEIDTLLWDSFDFNAKTLTVKPTKHYRLKTQNSRRTMPLDPLVADLFRRHFDSCGADGSDFVLQGSGSIGKQYRSHRCEKTFDRLRDWVRGQGINDKNLLRHLRKLAGENIYQRTGDIFKAKTLLGHSSVGTTEKHYVGGELTEVPSVEAATGSNVIPFVQPEETAGAAEAGERQKKGA